MVDGASYKIAGDLPAFLLESKLRWCSVRLREILEGSLRLDAGFYNTGGRQARAVLEQCKFPMDQVSGDTGIANAYYYPRFRRIWVGETGIPLILPSQITDVFPKPSGYISPNTKTDIEALRVKKGQILLTRSGTVGLCAIVGSALDGQVVSDDIIRIDCKDIENMGYLYAFLRTETGKAIIQTSEYGAVISHIEPKHLEFIPIPRPPQAVKKQVHDLVTRSCDLRDEAYLLLAKADQLLCNSLNLPPLSALRPAYFDTSSELRNYEVNLSELEKRLDASYHLPIVNVILRRLRVKSSRIATLGEDQISNRIILPARFSRVYVQEDQGGVPFFGGKEIYQLSPMTNKYLSRRHHGKRIEKEVALMENMILITRSGTIGRVAIVPEHWNGWAANEHIIRVEPTSANLGGYLYVFLASEYGRELITRFTYGAVVDEIDAGHVSKIPIPLLTDAKAQATIGSLALEAKAKLTEAHKTEQEAIRITNEEVIHAAKNE
ncbi:MAG: restriction endonuclease subunit S [Deltaproteobacteria bacterium]|nr:restriction endonuclease subunit S [Deltaproteobacteria bacterium]